MQNYHVKNRKYIDSFMVGFPVMLAFGGVNFCGIKLNNRGSVYEPLLPTLLGWGMSTANESTNVLSTIFGIVSTFYHNWHQLDLDHQRFMNPELTSGGWTLRSGELPSRWLWITYVMRPSKWETSGLIQDTGRMRDDSTGKYSQAPLIISTYIT